MDESLRELGRVMSAEANVAAQALLDPECRCAVVVLLHSSGVAGIGISGKASSLELRDVFDSLSMGLAGGAVHPNGNGKSIELDRNGKECP